MGEKQFRDCVEAEVVDLHVLRSLTWAGMIPCGSGARALAWQLLLEYLPEERSRWSGVLGEMRSRYKRIQLELSMHPTETAPEGDHPLSSGQDSHWARFFSVQETERLIALDVKRTHPGVHRFRELEPSMRRILLAYASQHASGYRQGMHELLAPLALVFSDAQRDSAEDAEADAYHCLCTIMTEMAPLYLSTGKELSRELDRLNEVLQVRDPKLHAHLASLNVEPSLYGFRWIRLWLTQEFDLADVLLLWDSILTANPRIPWLRYLCVAMVIAVRDKLLKSDFNHAAQILLRYSANNTPIQTILKLADALRTGEKLSTNSIPKR